MTPSGTRTQMISRFFLSVLFSFLLASCFFLAVPALAAISLSSGDLIKGPSAAVYYYGQDGKRYVFPNEKTYFTWYPSFSTVKVISAESLAAIPIGGNATYRPGVKLVKITTDPKVYAVAAHGTLRWMKTEALAISLYGTDWNKKIDDLPDTFFINYTVGAEISNASDFSPATETSTMKSINMDKKLVPIFDIPTSTESRSLKTLAEAKRIRFGAMYQSVFGGNQYDKIFAEEMNVLTAGTFMDDGDFSHKSRTEFDFSEMDEKINFGRANNMEVHGHILVWYGDIANWVKAAPLADVESIMNERIDAFMKRYAGKIKVWDVVNEAVNDGDGGYDLEEGRSAGTLRIQHRWAEAMGTDYIRKAFVRAHAADPKAILRYNDYSMEDNEAKYKGVKNLLINLKKQGAPVHALGWQMHVKPGSFDPATLLARMNEIADLGFDNYITELDVELPENATSADYEKQKQTYKTAIQTVLQARRLKSIVVWGLRDGDPDWLTNNHPQLFDQNLNKKPAYFGVQEALR